MHKITSDCTGCGTCVEECPESAIYPLGDIFTIAENCNNCGACDNICPVGAIIQE